jgi:ADP-ribose pyrophosphatase YjhB (NUDIX family)
MATLGAFAIVRDRFGQVLCVKQGYGELNWTTPGGRVEVGETPADALVREVLEETGLVVVVRQLVGVYDKRYCNDIVFSFLCDIVDDTGWTPSEEITSKGYFSSDLLPVPMASNTVLRIRDAVEKRWGIQRILNQPNEAAALLRALNVTSTIREIDTR